MPSLTFSGCMVCLLDRVSCRSTWLRQSLDTITGYHVWIKRLVQSISTTFNLLGWKPYTPTPGRYHLDNRVQPYGVNPSSNPSSNFSCKCVFVSAFITHRQPLLCVCAMWYKSTFRWDMAQFIFFRESMYKMLFT